MKRSMFLAVLFVATMLISMNNFQTDATVAYQVLVWAVTEDQPDPAKPGQVKSYSNRSPYIFGDYGATNIPYMVVTTVKRDFYSVEPLDNDQQYCWLGEDPTCVSTGNVWVDVPGQNEWVTTQHYFDLWPSDDYRTYAYTAYNNLMGANAAYFYYPY